MKRSIWTAALLAALILPRLADAQVEKLVEVTKEYAPVVQQATKLPMVPDMTDTTRMRPEISYTVTPLSLHTALGTQPIRPATVTYWDFNRPLPGYLKAGAGYPLNSVADLYLVTQHPDTGYALAYINHEGRYAKIRNPFAVKNNSTQMLNRIGGAAGKYIGRHTLEGSLSYENRLYHRYGAWADPSADGLLPAAPGARIDYGDAGLNIRIGDDFADLSRLNFDVTLGGGLFWDQSVWSSADDRARQTSLHAAGKIARAFGRHRIAVEAGFEHLAGRRLIDGFREQRLRAGARYGIEGGVVDFEVGADFWHDRIAGSDNGNYLLPFAHLGLNLGTKAIRPFLEIDGQLHDNSYRSLTRECPYLATGQLADRSSVDYNGRLGITGDLWRERFTYRLYAACSIRDHHNYWYVSGYATPDGDALLAAMGAMQLTQGRQTVTSIHGEAEFRPLSELLFELGLHGYLYNDDRDLAHGEPGFRAHLGARYTIKRITLGLSFTGESKRSWTLFYTDRKGTVEQGVFKAAAAMNLHFSFDWRVSGRFGVFAEGDNLLNQRIYRFPGYPEYGASCTAGIKLAF